MDFLFEEAATPWMTTDAADATGLWPDPTEVFREPNRWTGSVEVSREPLVMASVPRVEESDRLGNYVLQRLMQEMAEGDDLERQGRRMNENDSANDLIGKI